MSRILIVDDNSRNRYMLEAGLRGAGRDVRTAANGAEALESAREDPPDVVITDILMPVMDGYELCRRWKADERLRGIPFIFYTATYTDPKDMEFGLRLGADRYIVKPAAIEVLQDAVREVLDEASRPRPDFPASPRSSEGEEMREYNAVIVRKLESKVRQLEEEVAARRRAESELKVLFEREQALARSNEELELFAAAASHDLNAPLRKISAFAELLEARAGGKLDEQERGLLAKIGKGAADMSRLIADVLTLSRVARETAPVEDVDLNAALAAALSDLEIVIAPTGGIVESGPLPAVRGYRTSWRRLFQNLVANAVKYRAPDRRPRVVIRSQEALDGGAIISVEDNGVGFDPQFSRQIFLPFRRLPGAEIEGTGIGLAICERIAKRYGGGMTAESEPGRGSTFFVRLPADALVGKRSGVRS